MEQKMRYSLETLKNEGFLKDIFTNLNVASYNDLSFLIDKKVYTYIKSLRIFLTRLFEICYAKPLHEFNKLPLEVLLFFVHKKEKELEYCYPILERNTIYFQLKKIPSKNEYKEILKILSIIGYYIGKIYTFEEKYKDFLENLKIGNAKMIEIKNLQKSTRNKTWILNLINKITEVINSFLKKSEN